MRKYPDEYAEGLLSRMEQMFHGLAGKMGWFTWMEGRMNPLMTHLHLEITFPVLLQRPYTFYLPNLPTQMFFDASKFELSKVRDEVGDI